MANKLICHEGMVWALTSMVSALPRKNLDVLDRLTLKLQGVTCCSKVSRQPPAFVKGHGNSFSSNRLCILA